VIGSSFDQHYIISVQHRTCIVYINHQDPRRLLDSLVYGVVGVEIPELEELSRQGGHQHRVVRDHNVLAVVENRLARPVERAVDDDRVVNDTKLVVLYDRESE